MLETEFVKLCVLQVRSDAYHIWTFAQSWTQCHCQEFSITQEQTPVQMDVMAAVLSISTYGIILPYFCFFVTACVYCF